MKSLLTLLLTLTMLISPFIIQASDSAEQTSDNTESADTESSKKAESESTEGGADDGSVKEEEEPDCD